METGIGNLENGIAGKFLYDYMRRLVNDLIIRLARENQYDFDHYWEEIMAITDLLVFLGTTYRIGIDRNMPTVRYWRTTFLDLFDKASPSFGAKEGFVEERRKVIVTTFDKLEEIAGQHPTFYDPFEEAQKS